MDGSIEGCPEGWLLGTVEGRVEIDGPSLGWVLGNAEGALDGCVLGSELGWDVGTSDMEGYMEGCPLGLEDEEGAAESASACLSK